MPRTIKRGQRERLIDAMVELSIRGGYHEVSITELCAYAGVSSESFYEQFQSKEDCFLAAYRACAERIFAGIRAAVAGADWSAVPRLALAELFGNLERDPDAGRLLFIEALGAGPTIRAERRRVLAEFERGAEEALGRTPEDASRIDVPLTAVIGALRHVISRDLRAHSADRLPARLEDGVRWLYAYAVPASARRWSTSPAALLAGVPELAPAAWAPQTLPPGTHGLPASLIARSQRTRLIFATAEVMLAKGYQRAKITDIVAAARVGRGVFYEYFKGKEDAFLEAQQYPTQYILDQCIRAYFSAGAWPLRLWRCLETLLRLIAENPAISHLRLVECYAVGPAAIRRAEEVTRSFTMFLEEGYRYRPGATSLPRLFPHAIAGAIFEIVQRKVEQGESATLAAHLPQLAYIALAPFTGAQEAIALVEDMRVRDQGAGGRHDGEQRPRTEVVA